MPAVCNVPLVHAIKMWSLPMPKIGISDYFNITNSCIINLKS